MLNAQNFYLHELRYGENTDNNKSAFSLRGCYYNHVLFNINGLSV